MWRFSHINTIIYLIVEVRNESDLIKYIYKMKTAVEIKVIIYIPNIK